MADGYSRLVKKIKAYNPDCDMTLINKAHDLSMAAHEGQQRISGDPYIMHPVEVAIILAELELDSTSLIAALLHDTIEDTTCTLEQIEKEFGKEVATLVDGVTKLGKIPFNTREEQQAENLRKMFLAMAKDIRVIMIKLADRLHNMRTLNYLTPEKQLEKANETLEIYAPLAHRLGISRIKWELEDICLKYIDPKGYYDLVDIIAQKKNERERFISKILSILDKATKDLKIEKAHIEGRPKHFYSIYRKMQSQNKSIEQIYDLFAVRIIVNSVKDCYAILGIVHDLFKPVPGRFKDYIAMPKPNMYQSLHTTLIGPQGTPFEIQIRTWDMHRVAEVGIAAHWKYKEGIAGESDVDEKLTWLRQLLEWQNELRDANEFVENLKIDLYNDEVFVFSPKGDVINLPKGSTPIDFAYYIHSGVGNKMMGAKANGKIVTLGYELKNGDIVEILTSASIHGPSRDWLKIVKSSQAKSKINQWFKKEKREENIVRGKELVEKELKRQGLTLAQVFKQEFVDVVNRRYGFNSNDDLFSSIGYGAITSNKIISRLKEELRKTLKPEEIAELEIEPQKRLEKKKKPSSHSGIIVKGVDNCLARPAKCCNPVPGDNIIGYITRGRGVSVHRADCSNIAENLNDDQRLIEVSWYKAENVSYNAEITIMANERATLLLDITNVIGEAKIIIKAINARTTRDQIVSINLTLEIEDTEQLEKIIKALRKVNSVYEVTRNKQ